MCFHHLHCPSTTTHAHRKCFLLDTGSQGPMRLVGGNRGQRATKKSGTRTEGSKIESLYITMGTQDVLQGSMFTIADVFRLHILTKITLMEEVLQCSSAPMMHINCTLQLPCLCMYSTHRCMYIVHTLLALLITVNGHTYHSQWYSIHVHIP